MNGRAFMGDAMRVLDMVGFELTMASQAAAAEGADADADTLRFGAGRVARVIMQAVATYANLTQDVQPRVPENLRVRLFAEGNALSQPTIVWPSREGGVYALQFGSYAVADLQCDCGDCPEPVLGTFVDPCTVCCTLPSGESLALDVPPSYVPGYPLAMYQ